MKKLLSFFAIVAIVFSVSLLSACDSGSFCCESQHSQASDCTTCSPHMESSYSAGLLHPEIIFIPTVIGRIFYEVININQVKVVFTHDRPPAKLA